jgi:hypothetical protein
MAMSKQSDQDNVKRFDTSVEIRNFEIDLFSRICIAPSQMSARWRCFD